MLGWEQSDASTGMRGTGGLEEAQVNRGVAKVKTSLSNAMLTPREKLLYNIGTKEEISEETH